jgi:O-succinylbenzoate synthase
VPPLRGPDASPAAVIVIRAKMKLEQIEVRRVTLPLRFPFETSFGRTTVKQFLLVSVSAGGVSGHAECVADVDPFYLPETNVTALHVLREFLAPVAFSLEIGHPREVLPAFARVRGHEMAKAALEMAVWELWARREGVPLWKLLGGRGGESAAGVSVGLQEDEAALVDEVEAEVAAGYRRVKIKIKPGWEIEPVRLIREEFPDLPLMVDANSAFGLKDIPLLRRLDRFGLMMIEQPLAHDDLVDHARLQREIETPICLDESIHHVEDVRKAHELGSCRIINVKLGRVGGFTEAIKMNEYCVRHGIPIWCGGMLESGVGRLHNIAMSALAGFVLPGDVSASKRYYAEDTIRPPVTVTPKGTIRVPDGPGMGCELNSELIERATVRKQEFALRQRGIEHD